MEPIPARPRRSALVLAIAALAVVASACTSSDGGPATPVDGPAALPSVSVAPGETVYRYSGAGGVVAILRFSDATGGTLEVRNGTGDEIPAPGLYLLDARDGARTDLSVPDAAVVADGATATFSVTLGGFPLDEVGMFVLLLGGEDVGGFFPVT